MGSDQALGVLLVADGMGGHPAGEVASRLAVEEALRSLREGGNSALSETSLSEVGDAMLEAVRAADRRIRSEALRDPDRAGMGTTLTALRIDTEERRWWIGHVGDSRAYLLRDGQLRQLTRDDTWVQSEVEAGRLSREGARHHPWANLLSQAVGLEDPPFPSVLKGETRPGDVFLACSDGLLAHLDDEGIGAVLGDGLRDGLEAAALALVRAANEGGGSDNITVGLLAVHEQG